MQNNAEPVLVIGASGFLGGRVVKALRDGGRTVRCIVRMPARARHLTAEGVEIVEGDMLDAALVERATAGVAAVIVCVHTISPQPANDRGEGFTHVEAAGLRNVTDACRANGVRRVLYVTSIGVAERGTSSWLRGRWATEQALFASGLDATVVRPGMIVGRGGEGFSLVARAASHRFGIAVGSPRLRFRTVGVDDLAQDLVDLIDEPASFRRALEAGSDDVLTMRQMVAIAAESIDRRPGRMVFIPAAVVRAAAPLLERLARVPKGAIAGFVGDGPGADMIGDPTRLREILGRSDRRFRESIQGQLR